MLTQLFTIEEDGLPQFSDLSLAKPLRVSLHMAKPLRVSPFTTCAQVNKSERKLSKFAQVCLILACAPY